MRPGRVRPGPALGLIAAASLSLAACDIGGMQLSAQNESDQAVVIRAMAAESMEIVRIPPRTWGTVFSSRGSTPGTIDVLDPSCRLLASFPFDRSGSTVWVGPNGEIEVRERPAPVAEGMTRASASFEAALCG